MNALAFWHLKVFIVDADCIIPYIPSNLAVDDKKVPQAMKLHWITSAILENSVVYKAVDGDVELMVVPIYWNTSFASSENSHEWKFYIQVTNNSGADIEIVENSVGIHLAGRDVEVERNDTSLNKTIEAGA